MKMNKRKLLFFAGLSLLAVSNLFAENNERGIDYFRAELYDAAKIFFLQQTNQSPSEQAENYYYLGETYYQLNKLDSASYYYKKAIQISPEYPFGYIGEGKMELKKENVKTADDLFKKASNFAKKNPAVQTTIAEVYVNVGDNNKAIIAIDNARKINNKYPGIYIVEGDMLMKEGKIGDASSRYNNAIIFDKSYKVAYLKYAQIYKNINFNTALDYLNQLIALDPNYIPAYAILGDIYREARRYMDALNAYEKFIAIPGVPLLQHEYYAQLLYFTNQYEKALDHIKYVLSKDPDNLIMKRIEAYNSLRLENFALGLEQINRLLEIMEEERHIYLDYTTLGQLAAKEKHTQLALEAYQKAIDLDPERAITDDLYKEMATLASNAGLYPEAVGYYEKFFAIETSPEPLDFFNYGNACSQAAAYYINPENIASVTTPEEVEAYEAVFKNYIQKGEKAYAELIARRPNMHLGFMRRANIYSQLDFYDGAKGRKLEGHAKPFYEEALNMMLENNSDGSKNIDIIIAYRYLVSYYYAINDMPNVIDYSKKILAIDPNDNIAKQTLTALKVKF